MQSPSLGHPPGAVQPRPAEGVRTRPPDPVRPYAKLYYDLRGRVSRAGIDHYIRLKELTKGRGVIGLSDPELAGRFGLSRGHVRRLNAELVAEGLIEKGYRVILILDERATASEPAPGAAPRMCARSARDERAERALCVANERALRAHSGPPLKKEGDQKEGCVSRARGRGTAPDPATAGGTHTRPSAPGPRTPDRTEGAPDPGQAPPTVEGGRPAESPPTGGPPAELIRRVRYLLTTHYPIRDPGPWLSKFDRPGMSVELVLLFIAALKRTVVEREIRVVKYAERMFEGWTRPVSPEPYRPGVEVTIDDDLNPIEAGPPAPGPASARSGPTDRELEAFRLVDRLRGRGVILGPDGTLKLRNEQIEPPSEAERADLSRLRPEVLAVVEGRSPVPSPGRGGPPDRAFRPGGLPRAAS